ncbi:MAG: TVP38/TMEM64 family protein [Planctomycetota bacterium]|nr:MAG: TVP38/TMEM64 family protein [Planctomycetota bacterium]
MISEQERRSRRQRRAWIALFAVVLVGIGLVVPVAEWADAVRSWMLAWGPWGPLLMIAVLSLWGIALPILPLQVISGALFGAGMGIFVSYVGTSIAMALTLAVGRYVLRGPVARWIARYPTTRAIDAALVAEGWRAIVLIRFSNMVPAHIVHWALSVSAMPMRVIIPVLLLTKIPGAVILASAGSAGLGTEDMRSGPMVWIVVAVSIVASILAAYFLGRRARQFMQREMQRTAALELQEGVVDNADIATEKSEDGPWSDAEMVPDRSS